MNFMSHLVKKNNSKKPSILILGTILADLFEVPCVEVDIGSIEVSQGVGGVHLDGILVVLHGIHTVLHELKQKSQPSLTKASTSTASPRTRNKYDILRNNSLTTLKMNMVSLITLMLKKYEMIKDLLQFSFNLAYKLQYIKLFKKNL